MSTPLKEFSVNLPLASIGGATQQSNAAVQTPQYDITSDVAIPPDVDAASCSHISVFVDSCSITTFDVENPTACVDLVLTVSITDPETYTNNVYKLVKRLSMDKCKLAIDASTCSPIQVIEALEDQEEVQREMDAFYAGMRAREIAGLQESAGNKCATVLFSFDADGKRKYESIELTAVKNKAHARHVFETLHSGKYKNTKLARVTMIEGEI